ncbi:prenylated rab acceptor 1-related [Anaeramoeba ignava]|uniref:PRA1 family protein n=1 Tax=Anaeramoeba ignava TaxID=1746090 RepID=A0A9Q0LXW8_ANAIG|nr:prenylated rab acceptor 1-related [Anaeramoeba ignava]
MEFPFKFQFQIRSWKYFIQNFKFPEKKQIKKSIQKNLEYFLANYLIIISILLMIVLILQPFGFTSLFFPSIFIFYFFIINKGNEIIIDEKKAIFLCILMFIPILQIINPVISLKIILVAITIIVLHALFHLPLRDDFENIEENKENKQ